MANNWQDKVHTVYFSAMEEDTVRLWVGENKPNWVTCLEELVDDGWSVKVTPPGKGDDYWCTITCKDSKSPFNGHSFSTRYPDLALSVILAYYVANVMIERGELDQFARSNGKNWLG